MEFGLHCLDLLIERRDFVAHDAHRLDPGLAVGRVFLFADLLRDGVPLRFERFHFVEQVAAFTVQFEDGIHWGRVVLPVAQCLADNVWLFADEIDV